MDESIASRLRALDLKFNVGVGGSSSNSKEREVRRRRHRRQTTGPPTTPLSYHKDDFEPFSLPNQVPAPEVPLFAPVSGEPAELKENRPTSGNSIDATNNESRKEQKGTRVNSKFTFSPQAVHQGNSANPWLDAQVHESGSRGNIFAYQSAGKPTGYLFQKGQQQHVPNKDSEMKDAQPSGWIPSGIGPTNAKDQGIPGSTLFGSRDLRFNPGMPSSQNDVKVSKGKAKSRRGKQKAKAPSTPGAPRSRDNPTASNASRFAFRNPPENDSKGSPCEMEIESDSSPIDQDVKFSVNFADTQSPSANRVKGRNGRRMRRKPGNVTTNHASRGPTVRHSPLAQREGTGLFSGFPLPATGNETENEPKPAAAATPSSPSPTATEPGINVRTPSPLKKSEESEFKTPLQTAEEGDGFPSRHGYSDSDFKGPSSNDSFATSESWGTEGRSDVQEKNTNLHTDGTDANAPLKTDGQSNDTNEEEVPVFKVSLDTPTDASRRARIRRRRKQTPLRKLKPGQFSYPTSPFSDFGSNQQDGNTNQASNLESGAQSSGEHVDETSSNVPKPTFRFAQDDSGNTSSESSSDSSSPRVELQGPVPSPTRAKPVRRTTRRVPKRSEMAQIAQRWKATGNSFYKDKNYEKAMEAYSTAVRLDPSNPVHLTNRAAAYMMLDEYGKALQDCVQATKVDSTNTKAWQRAGKIAFAMGLTKKATDYFSRAKAYDSVAEVSKYKKKFDAAQKALGSGRGAAALRLGQQCLYLAPRCPVSYVLCAAANLCRVRSDDSKHGENATEEESRQYIASAAKMSKEWMHGCDNYQSRVLAPAVRHAKEMNSMNMTSEALVLLKLVTAHSDSIPISLETFQTQLEKLIETKEDGNRKFRSGKYREAIDSYTRATLLPRASSVYLATIYCNRAAAYMAIKSYGMAVNDCTKALSLRPHSFQKALLRRARAFVGLGKFKKALLDFEKAYRLDPTPSIGDELRQVRAKIRADRQRSEFHSRRNTNGYSQRHSYYQQNNNSYNRSRNQSPPSQAHTTAKETHYDVLNIKRTASQADIRKAYKLAALKYHPDKNTDNPDAGERFKLVGEAYSILKDESSRRDYDREIRVTKTYSSSYGYSRYY